MCSFNSYVHALWALRQRIPPHFQQRRQKVAFRLSNLRSSASTTRVAGMYFKWLLGVVLLLTKRKREEGLNLNQLFFHLLWMVIQRQMTFFTFPESTCSHKEPEVTLQHFKRLLYNFSLFLVKYNLNYTLLFSENHHVSFWIFALFRRLT